MPKVLKEGQVGEATDAIEYPEVNSCLTITYIDPQRKLFGGHAIVVPDEHKQQHTIDQIVDYIKSHSQQDGGKLLLVGSLGVWRHPDTLRHASKKHKNFEELVKDLKGKHRHETVKEEDIENKLITIHPDGSITTHTEGR